MRKLLSTTPVIVTSFQFNKICNGCEWEYTATWNPLSDTWSCTRRKISDARIPPFMQMLGIAELQKPHLDNPGVFWPVLGEKRPAALFKDPEDLVRYIEENFDTSPRVPFEERWIDEETYQ